MKGKVHPTPDGWDFREISIDGQPWYVVADVCKGLGHSNPTEAIRSLHPQEKRKINLSQVEGIKRWGGSVVNVINKHGLRKLMMRSDKPGAVAFQDWLNHVVDQVEDDGMFVTESRDAQMEHDLSSDEGIIKILQEIAERQLKRAQFAESQVEEMKPIVQIYDSAWKGESACLTEFFQFALSTRVDTRTCRRLKDQLIEAGVLMDRHGQEEPTDSYLPYFKFLPFVNRYGGKDSLQLHVRSDKRHELAAKIRPFLSI